MSASSQIGNSRSGRVGRSHDLIQWQLYPDAGNWKVNVDCGRERLISAASPSRAAARAFVVHARELLLGRSGQPIPPALAWGQLDESRVIAHRVAHGRVLELTVEDRGAAPAVPAEPRFRWQVEQLDSRTIAEGRAFSFLQAELLALAAAEILPSRFITPSPPR